MSIFDRKKLIEEYTEEIKKQTDPYGFFCRNENVKRGEHHEEGFPPFCVIESLLGLLSGRYGTDYGSVFSDKKYILLSDPGSEYELDEIGDFINGNDGLDLLYWDEDRVLSDKRHAPFFKPDWSPDTLLNCNYIGDSFVVGVTLAIGIIQSMMEEANILQLYEQQTGESEIRYDFLLRASEAAGRIVHLPVIAQHIMDETADDDEIYAEYTWRNQSQKYIKLRNDAFIRRGINISYDKVFERKDNSVINNNAINNIVIKPSDDSMDLSVIIPSKDHSDILIACLESIRRCFIPTYNKHIEIIIVDNGSSSAEGLKIEDYLRVYPKEIPVKYIYNRMEFNYSVMCNIGVREASCDMFLFLNDDIELTDDNTLERMYAYASLAHVGAVGAKLYYPGGNIIQHTGVAVGLDCGPTHKLATYPDDKPYYYGRNVFNLNVLAVTGACLMVTREKYFKCDGFNDKMGIGYNDIDLCIKLYEQGYMNVLLNECILFHHESLSRGLDHMDDNKYMRLKDERMLMYDLHPWILKDGDPFYSVNLISDTLDYTVNIMPDYAVRSLRNSLVEDEKLRLKITALVREDERNTEQGGRAAGRHRGSGKVHFNIERTGTFRGIMKDEEDYYCIEGWATLSKRDNALYTTEIALVPEDGECLVFDTFKVSREDVAVVFVNEKNLFLTGFVCKINASLLNKDEVYRIAVIKRSGLTGKKYVALGDYYEPSRGYRAAKE